jgi:UDPglucose--hexose-1-phosphate uridylyltransferase
MSQLRLNPLTGRWVAVAAQRAGRPGLLVSKRLPVETEPVRPCPFCPGHEEATLPALETYPPDGRWLVRAIPNRYPAFEGDAPLQVNNLGPVFTEAAAAGTHEVLVFTPQHDAAWADLDDRQIDITMTAIRDRMEDHRHDQPIRYTQAIVNHGREAGASLEHPHAQLLGIPFVPGEIAEEEAGFRRFEGSCVLCTTMEAESTAGHRIVQADGHVVVVCPYWSGGPYEMLVVPRRHAVHLTDAKADDVEAVGRALRTAVAKLRTTLGETAYNLVFHTAPHHHGGPYHWHVHVLPRVTSAPGFEQGTGVMINILAPEAAARQLNAVG